jgi:hypothetical protein
MTSRFVSLTARGFLGCLALILVIAALVLFRLWLGPIQVGFLTPHLERAVAGERSGRRLEIDDTVVAWDVDRHSIDLLARGVRVLERDGTRLAVLPEVAVRLDLEALLGGTIAPTSIEILAARLTLVRGEDGSFLLGDQDDPGKTPGLPVEVETAGAEGDLSQIIADLVRDLISEPDPLEPFTFLKEVRVKDGSISVDDRQFGVTWRGADLDMSLRRALGGLTGELQFRVAMVDRFATLKADVSYNQSFDRLGVTVFFSDLWPPAVAAAIPDLEALSALNVAFNGSLIGSLDLQGRLRDLGFEVSGGPGTIWHPEFLSEPQPVSRITAQGYLDFAKGTLRVDQAAIAIEGEAAPRPTLKLQGQARGFGGDVTASGQATLSALPVQDLKRFWPPGAGGEARHWVLENLAAGTLERVSVGAEVTLPDGDLERAVVAKLSGRVAYQGVELHYRRPLPPVTVVKGTATFSPERLRFKFAEARSAGLTLVDGTAEVTGLDRDREAVALKFGVAGELGDVLGLLSHPELDLLSGSGIDPALAKGQALARVGLSFPLAPEISVDAVAMEVQGRLENASIRNLLLGQDMERGQLDLALDPAGLRLTGTLDFAGVPLSLDWSEALTKKRAWKRKIEVTARRVDSARLATLGLDPGDSLEGPLSIDLAATFGHDGKGIVNTVVDLGEAKLELPAVNWRKAPGTAGSAEAVLELAGDRPRALTKLDVRAGTLALTGRARFDRRGRTIESAKFDRISFGPDRNLRDVSIDLARGQAGWELIRAAGEVVDRPAARRGFALDYGPAATGTYELSARAEDLGATLRALGLHDGIAGGRLTLEGRGERPGPGSPIQAALEVTNFTLLEAPMLAQILAGTSYSGWRNLLGDGVTFDRLWGDLRLENSTVGLTSSRETSRSAVWWCRPMN